MKILKDMNEFEVLPKNNLSSILAYEFKICKQVTLSDVRKFPESQSATRSGNSMYDD